MPFTFDSPISTSSAYQKIHTRKSVPSPLQSSKANSSPSLLSKLNLRFPGRNGGAPIPKSVAQPTAVADSLFFRLPLPLRQQIYGYALGQHERLHILLKRRASSIPYGYSVAHRRCRARGDSDDCVASRCRELLDIADGTYFGSFDRVAGLLLTCRDIYEEASAVFYEQNEFDFDHPLAFLVFSVGISSSALHRIRSVSFAPQRHLAMLRTIDASRRSFQAGHWEQMWDIVAVMKGLEEVRVTFQSPLLGWDGQTLLDPLCKIMRPFKVFEVDAPWISEEMGMGGRWEGTRNAFQTRSIGLKDNKSTSCLRYGTSFTSFLNKSFTCHIIWSYLSPSNATNQKITKFSI